jgi:uncharacterized protein (TIGR02246 family)
MKPKSLLCSIALLAIVTLFLLNMPPIHGADSGDTKAAILALEKKYDEASNNKDAAALAALYHEDAQILTADRGIIKGRRAIEAFHREEMKTHVGKTTSTPIEIEDHGDTAIETGSWATTQDDGTVSAKGSYMGIWKRQDGQWKISREIWNTHISGATN